LARNKHEDVTFIVHVFNVLGANSRNRLRAAFDGVKLAAKVWKCVIYAVIYHFLYDRIVYLDVRIKDI
jgi:hypothetical protein